MARPVTRVACVRRNQESRELASDQAHKLAIDLTKRINLAIYRLHPIRLLDEPVTETNVLQCAWRTSCQEPSIHAESNNNRSPARKKYYEKVYPRLPEQKSFNSKVFHLIQKQ